MNLQINSFAFFFVFTTTGQHSISLTVDTTPIHLSISNLLLLDNSHHKDIETKYKSDYIHKIGDRGRPW